LSSVSQQDVSQQENRPQARTNVEELRIVAKAASEKLNSARGPVKFLIPIRGWSTLSVKDQPLYDPKADRIFVEEPRKQFKPEIEVLELDVYLNTPEFAMAVVEAFEAMMKEQVNRKSIP
jgi:uncharacterized protein (UPF0261 family)